MKRATLSCLFILLAAVGALAQDGNDRIVPRISLLGPAIGVEVPIGEQGSVQALAALGVGFEVVNGNNFIQSQFLLAPQISVQPRYYFDLLNRAAQGADVADFAADFFTVDLSWQRLLTQTGNFTIYAAAPALGLQRNLGRSSYISIHAGPEFRLGDRLVIGPNWLTIGGRLNLGFRLGANRR